MPIVFNTSRGSGGSWGGRDAHPIITLGIFYKHAATILILFLADTRTEQQDVQNLQLNVRGGAVGICGGVVSKKSDWLEPGLP
jgi:hypothetical protein